MTGPPASGKTTYVLNHASPGAIVVDYDLLAAALTAGAADTHRHPRPVQQVAHRARRAAVREGLRQARSHEVWVVHSAPSPDALAEYQAHHAHLITIDPGQDVVLARCEQLRPPGSRDAALRWYAQRDHLPPTTLHAQSDITVSNDHGSRDW
ncbi:AAA family ATPase [Spirillospora sp. CA-128828]|uniref:AAA family ATPase n=1 Tax=Spirillospora sp. CA-128828 TaxID=3240033 RepID=UPI003D8D6324